MTKQTTHIWAEVQGWLDSLQFKPSQARLAESVGVARSAISDWKYGKTMPTPDHLARLARVMNQGDAESVYDQLLVALNRDQGYVPMPEEAGEEHDRSAATKTPAPGPADQPGTHHLSAVKAARHAKSRGKARAEADEGVGEESQDDGGMDPS